MTNEPKRVWIIFRDDHSNEVQYVHTNQRDAEDHSGRLEDAGFHVYIEDYPVEKETAPKYVADPRYVPGSGWGEE